MTENKIVRRVVLLFGLLIAIGGTVARAQYEDGSLIGTIRDASGAVVGNATVTVTNVNTGIVTKVASNNSGDYEVPALRVGVYTIEAEATGFAPAEAKNITISVAGRQHIDLTLNVGQADAAVGDRDKRARRDCFGISDGSASPREPQLLRFVGIGDRFAASTDSGYDNRCYEPGSPRFLQCERTAKHVQQLSAGRYG
jgi:hypothetical protein